MSKSITTTIVKYVKHINKNAAGYYKKRFFTFLKLLMALGANFVGNSHIYFLPCTLKAHILYLEL